MRSKLTIGVIGIVIGVLFSSVVVVLAGNLSPASGPTGPDSQMYTLEQLYDRLDTGAAATKMTAFTEPSSGPGSTMHTLDDIMAAAPAADDANGAGVADVASGKTFWGLASGQWGLRTGTANMGTYGASVPKTGQTTSYATGDDGDLERGVAWPVPRFTDNGDGTVTDNLTGLIWLKNVDCFGTSTWDAALTAANTLSDGECGLTDGSVEGAWRLPNIRELRSLIDYGRSSPPLPNGHPFTGWTVGIYWWTSTTYAANTDNAWLMYGNDGRTSFQAKATATHHVWPVRGGQ